MAPPGTRTDCEQCQACISSPESTRTTDVWAGRAFEDYSRNEHVVDNDEPIRRSGINDVDDRQRDAGNNYAGADRDSRTHRVRARHRMSCLAA